MPSGSDHLRRVRLPSASVVRRQLKLARVIEHSVAAFVDGDHYAAGRAEADFVAVLLHECLAVARRADTSGGIPVAYWVSLDHAPDGPSSHAD